MKLPRDEDGCVACPPNTFCSSGAATACGNNSMAPPGATSSANCSCIAGFYLVSTACVPCPANRSVSESFHQKSKLFTLS